MRDKWRGISTSRNAETVPSTLESQLILRRASGGTMQDGVPHT